MDFVVISTADWDNPFWTNKQHNAKVLADMGHRVLYIDSLGLRKPTGTTTDFLRIINKLHRMIFCVRKVDVNIWVISPFSLPWHSSKIINNINKTLLITYIKLFCKSHNFKNIILWTYNPIVDYLIDSSFFKKTIYNCVDEISAQPGMPKEFIRNSEMRLLKKVDYVFVTSKMLLSKKKYNNNIYYFSNVADYNHFSKAIDNKYEIPRDIKLTDKNRIGFIGAISGYKLNFNLILKLAMTLPNFDFYFIGKIGEGEPQTNIDILKEQTNIIFLGPKDYAVLPQYLHFFDACILPCNINEYTDNMFPMKFFEYLAAGKAVVATELKSILDYKDYCFISKDDDEFIKNLKEAVYYKNDSSLIQMRQSLAKQFTYNSRMKKMLKIITESNLNG